MYKTGASNRCISCVTEKLYNYTKAKKAPFNLIEQVCRRAFNANPVADRISDSAFFWSLAQHVALIEMTSTSWQAEGRTLVGVV